MRDTIMNNNQLNFQKKQSLFGITNKLPKKSTKENLPRLRLSFEAKQGYFPGYDHVNLKFFIHYGPTWNLEAGQTAGVSHCVSRRVCGNYY